MEEAIIKVRAAKMEDLDEIEAIVNEVVKEMNAVGNYQWDEVYPLRENFKTDIDNGELWVACENNGTGKVLGMSALTEEQSIEYKECGWDISIPAIVMHRTAVSTAAQRRGVAQMFFAKQDEISRRRGYNLCRVDTNRDNLPMQASIKKAGYEYSGDVRLLTKPESMKFMCFQKHL
jgi:GNAT superfamily N-acetyltransferase